MQKTKFHYANPAKIVDFQDFVNMIRSLKLNRYSIVMYGLFRVYSVQKSMGNMNLNKKQCLPMARKYRKQGLFYPDPSVFPQISAKIVDFAHIIWLFSKSLDV